ncbi:hypothetical protein [Rhodoferax sp. TH121]|uniref:hypothetical protein n=1 Tax=Rhodoferax sp. TH121 TaxID=2022803 RepID=UPI001595289B|nr:hypothetical protein [Rhodoferax sp. TH121]
MHLNAQMLLTWIRTDPHSHSYTDGITFGFLLAERSRLEPWEIAYVENVMNARQKGIAA